MDDNDKVEMIRPAYIYCPNCVNLKLPHPRIFGNVLSGTAFITPSTCVILDESTDYNLMVEIHCDKCKKYSKLKIL